MIENISFLLYKSSDYLQPIYSTCVAQVHVAIEKFSAKGEGTVIWDKTFDTKNLSQYSPVESPLKENVEINNVPAKNEYLVVRYDVTYNSKGSELKIPNAVIVKNANTQKITIGI